MFANMKKNVKNAFLILKVAPCCSFCTAVHGVVFNRSFMQKENVFVWIKEMYSYELRKCICMD